MKKKEKLSMCGVCWKEFKTLDKLLKHFRKKHKEVDEE